METIQVIIMTVLMFFVIVTVHEWGHYFFAKRAGVLVREFAIGFGPKLFSYKKDETVFTLRLLPFGGYARMAGEDPELADHSARFCRQPDAEEVDRIRRKLGTNGRRIVFFALGMSIEVDELESLPIWNSEDVSFTFRRIWRLIESMYTRFHRITVNPKIM